MPVEVDCSFDATGQVRVRRVRLGSRWRVVEQGRQWQDVDGRHVLIRLPEGYGGTVRELLLRADALVWELRDRPGAKPVV